MKVLVTYYSETGNTEKVARAIYAAAAEGAPGIDIDAAMVPLSQAELVDRYDLVFCGFPIQMHSVPPKAVPFLRGLPQGTKVALFATHGSLRGGRLAVQGFEHAMTLASKARVIGTFGCRGKVKSSLLDALMEKPEHRAWAQEALGAAEHPSDYDCDDARQFAKAMISKARS